MTERGARLAPALLLLALLLAFGGSAWTHPWTRALGDAGSEAPGHLWGLWVSWDGILANGPFLRVAPGTGHPSGFLAHLIDPIDLLPFGLGALLGGGGRAGAVLGWNLLHLLAFGLAGWGCWRLGGRLAEGDPPGKALARTVLIGTFTASSALFLHPWLGRTEYLAGVLMPHLLVELEPAVVRGGRGPIIRAGLLVGGIALGGPVLATFLGLALLPLGLAMWASGPDRSNRLGRLCGVALLGLLVWSPAALALIAHPPIGMPTPWLGGERPATPVELSQVLALGRMGSEGSVRGSLDPPAYIGLLCLGLALIGAVARPRRAAGWLALGLWLGLLSLGSQTRIPVGEGSTEVLLPAGLLQAWIPPLRSIRIWARIAILTPLPLGLAAAHGALALRARLPGWGGRMLAPLLGLALVLDQATWPRADAWERPTFEIGIPPDLSTLLDRLPDGPVVTLPIELALGGPGRLFEAGFWQLWLWPSRRPLSATPDPITDATLPGHATTRILANHQILGGEPEGAALLGVRDRATEAADRDCALRDLPSLRQEGFVAFVLLTDREGGGIVETDLHRWFGLPQETVGAAQAWILDRLKAKEDGPCPMPDPHPRLQLMISNATAP